MKAPALFSVVFILAVASVNWVHAQRPEDPWVRRALMKEKPSMIILALHSNLSVAYDGINCGFYTAWNGGVQDGNDTYSQSCGNYGGTYYPEGPLFHKQSLDATTPAGPIDEDRCGRPSETPPTAPFIKVWTVIQNGQPLDTEAKYKGYTLDNDNQTIAFRYDISLPGGKIITVFENPDYTSEGNNHGIKRVFKFVGIGAGQTVRLKLSGSTVQKPGGGTWSEDWTVTGTGASVGQAGGDDVLSATANGLITLTGIWR